MLFTSVVVAALAATAAAKPIRHHHKRGGKKCSSVFPSRTATTDGAHTTGTASSSSVVIVSSTSATATATGGNSNTTPGSTVPGTPSSTAGQPSSTGGSGPSGTPSSSAGTPSSTAGQPSSTAGQSTSSTAATSTAASTTLSTSIVSTTSVPSSTTAVPSTTSTSSSALPSATNSVAVGTLYTHCTVPGVVALTFDDGPFQYSNGVMQLLEDAGMKGTFFMNGDNWAKIGAYPDVVHRAYEKHQVGSHTFKHTDLNAVDDNAIRAALTDLETEFVNILGKWPNYLRPPYLNANDHVLSIVGPMGYKVFNVDIDTNDWQDTHKANVQLSVDAFVAGLNAGGNLVLEHDVHETTAVQLVPKLIEELQKRNLRSVTVGECMGEDSSRWYSAPRVN